MEDLQILEMCPKSGGVPAVLGGAMTSLWVGCWRSEVPSVYSPECVEGLLRSSPNDDSRLLFVKRRGARVLANLSRVS
jgi:hypothetical protein